MTSESCIFCKIARGEVKSEILYSDDEIVAFKDINPQAPFHILIIPRKHIEKHSDIGEEDVHLLGKMHLVAKKLAQELGISDGYRLVLNCGEKAGQSVWHIHLHLLGGRVFHWPPG